MSIQRIIDHERQALKRLLAQYADKENISKFIKIYSKQTQELESVFFNLSNIIDINGSGWILDVTGGLVGVSRNFSDDDEFRFRIQTRIAAFGSNGTIPSILQVVAAITGASSIQYEPDYPAGYKLSVDDLNQILDPQVIQGIIEAISPSGVGVQIQSSTQTPFGFDGVPDALGFGSTANTEGGQLQSLIS
jgi:hypothetical protein